MVDEIEMQITLTMKSTQMATHAPVALIVTADNGGGRRSFTVTENKKKEMAYCSLNQTGVRSVEEYG